MVGKFRSMTDVVELMAVIAVPSDSPGFPMLTILTLRPAGIEARVIAVAPVAVLDPPVVAGTATGLTLNGGGLKKLRLLLPGMLRVVGKETVIVYAVGDEATMVDPSGRPRLLFPPLICPMLTLTKLAAVRAMIEESAGVDELPVVPVDAEAP